MGCISKLGFALGRIFPVNVTGRVIRHQDLFLYSEPRLDEALLKLLESDGSIDDTDRALAAILAKNLQMNRQPNAARIAFQDERKRCHHVLAPGEIGMALKDKSLSGLVRLELYGLPGDFHVPPAPSHFPEPYNHGTWVVRRYQPISPQSRSPRQTYR